MTYAIPDLHGSDDLLEKALNAVLAHHAADRSGERTVVFLGDYVDRGSNSRNVLDRLMVGPPAGWRWVCLMGNHERMMVNACRGVDPEIWMANGAHATLRCFALDWREIEPYELPAPYVDWVDGLALAHLDRHRIYVHAGLDRARPLGQQHEDDLLWSRDPDPSSYQGRHIVHGHDAKRDGPELMKGRTNLDTLAWRTGRLVIGVFDDDDAGGPCELLEVRRDGQARALSDLSASPLRDPRLPI